MDSDSGHEQLPREKHSGRFEAVRQAARDFQEFIRTELWNVDTATLPRLRKLGVSLLRVAVLVGKGFAADNCTLQASALTYITLMSLVPVLALTFSMSKGFGAQDAIMRKIGLQRVPAERAAASTPSNEAGGESRRTASAGSSAAGPGLHGPAPAPRDQAGKPLEDHNAPETTAAGDHAFTYVVVPGGPMAEFPPQFQRAIVQVFLYVDRTDFSKLGVAGSLLLVFTVIKVMGKVESTFNQIWGVKEHRPFRRKFADYLSVLLTVPLLILAAGSLIAALSSGRLVELLQTYAGPLYGLYMRVIRLSGIAMLCAAFAFLYSFMPNTRVRLFPAIAGGVTGAVLWATVQYCFVNGQISLTKYNALYGTFAAIPIFLFWLYTNWVIVLFGAEVSFAVQNHRTYVLERAVTETSYATRELLGFIIMYEVCRKFAGEGGAWNATEFAHRHGIPVRLTLAVLHSLVAAGLLMRSAEAEDEVVPGRSPDSIRLWDIEAVFRGKADGAVELILKESGKPLGDIVNEWRTQIQNALAGKTMRDVLAQAA